MTTPLSDADRVTTAASTQARSADAAEHDAATSPAAAPSAQPKHLTDDEVKSTASSVLKEGERPLWFDDYDARLDKLAEVTRNLDVDSRKRLVGELVKQDPGAIHSWLEGSRLNDLTAAGRISAPERQALAEGVAGAYNRGALTYTQMQDFLGVNTQFAPAISKEAFEGARTLAAGNSPELSAFRERFLRDSFALTAQRQANGMGAWSMDSAFAVTLANDGGQRASIARAFTDLDPTAQRAVASEVGLAAIGYRNSGSAIPGLTDPLATLTQSVRANLPPSTDAGRLALTRIADGLAANRDVELQGGATALYREVADARAQQFVADPDLRARSLARVADAQNAAAQVLSGLPANATPEQVWAAYQRNPSAVVAPTFSQYLELRGDTARSLQGAALRNDIGLAMGLQPNRAPQSAQEQADFNSGQFDYFGGDGARAVRAVEAKINEVGGPNARVAALPVTVAAKEFGVVQVPLFRVEGADGRAHYVDYNPASGEARTYRDFADWRDNNKLPPGRMTFAANGHLTAGVDGKPQLVTANTPGTPDTFWEKWGQPALDGAALVGGVVLLGAAVVGSGGTVLLVGGALVSAYGVARGGEVLADRATHGQSVDPLQSAEARNAWLNVGAGVVGFAAAGSSLRLASAAGRVTGLEEAANLTRLATTTRALNVAAQYTDTAAMVDTGFSLAANWDRLTPQQRVAALAQMAFWAGGTAVAARQSGGLGNLYGVGDMSAALGRTNQWLKSQLPEGTQIKQVLSQAADAFMPRAGERVVEMVTPDGMRIKVVVENQPDNAMQMTGNTTGGASRTPPLGDQMRRAGFSPELTQAVQTSPALQNLLTRQGPQAVKDAFDAYATARAANPNANQSFEQFVVTARARANAGQDAATLNARARTATNLDAPSIDLLTRHQFRFDEATGLWTKVTRTGKVLAAEVDANGRWTVDNISDNRRIVEYTMAPYNRGAPTRGADNFLQAHHPLQDDWGRERLGGLGYDSNAAPSIALRDSFADSPHQTITARQVGRGGSITSRTYLQERALMVDDLRAAGVPQPQIDNAVRAVDDYYRGLWQNIGDASARNRIFGDVRGTLGW